MSPKGSSNSVDQLRELIVQAKDGTLPIPTFCESFERIYNLELDKKSLPAKEGEQLSKLFDLVVFFSPYPEELARIPNYRSEAQIRDALNAIDLD